MKLSDQEEAMLSGAEGPARKFAMEQIVSVGRFFDAEDCVEVSQVHLMADSESLGVAGVEFLESISQLPASQRKVCVPTVTDPRGIDFKSYEKLKQTVEQVNLERRAVSAFRSFGVMMTDTCINYQSIMPPVLGEHLAFGDTGSSIYANSVQGARTNFEGGPSALAAALTGRTARYGYHLDACRKATTHFDVQFQPKDLSEWGALGAWIGKKMTSYWEVPLVTGINSQPTSDELKQFGAALASFGSTPLFHMEEITPEACELAQVFSGRHRRPEKIIKKAIDDFQASYFPDDEHLDVVVFAAPQLSLLEMKTLGDLLESRRIHKNVSLIAATSPEIKAACDRMGITDSIEQAGGLVLEGVCFYQMYAREIGEANGWKRLISNSAKLVNILGGYGYEPVLLSMELAVESAVKGRIVFSVSRS